MQGDKYLLRRMLENLIQNSISHNPDGCHITLSIKETEEKYVLIVSDNGFGVPPVFQYQSCYRMKPYLPA